MPLNIPYDKLPDGSPLLLTDIMPILRSPNEEYRVTVQDVADTVLAEIPAPSADYDASYTGVTTNGTSPTGTPNHRVSWEVSSGRMCHAHFHINWPNTGVGITTFTIPLADGMPDPLLPDGVSGANANIVPCFAILQTALTAEATARGILKVNAANNGYEIEVVAGSNNYRICNVFVSYFTAAT